MHPLAHAHRLDAGSVRPLRLAFIDPGLRKAPFFLALRNWLAPRVECLYWSQRSVVRSYMRSARVAMHPPESGGVAGQFAISDAELRVAVGMKELALRHDQALRKARRLLAQLAAFIDGEKVDAILVWNGSNLRGALAIYLARQRGLPVVYAEHGYLPGTTQLDLEGVNFNASICRHAHAGSAQLPSDPELDSALDADILRFKTGAKMHDLDPLPPADLRRNLRARLASRLGFWLSRRVGPRINSFGMPRAGSGALPERYVLLPFQVRGDSQLVLHSPLYGNDMEAVVRELDAALERIDPGLRLVAKFHPLEKPQVQRGYRELPRRHPRVHFVSTAPMNRLLEKATAVVTINSTTGFEALLYDKPVLAMGRNFYTVPGIVDCLSRRKDLEGALRQLLAGKPDSARRRDFLRFVRARLLAAGGYHDFSERSLRTVAGRIEQLLVPERPAAGVAPTDDAEPAALSRFG